MFDSIDLETPPSWSYSWCYYFFIAAVLAFVGVVGTGIMKFKQLGVFSFAIILLSSLIPLMAGMTQFWMCRSSLKQYSA
jgi:hypothetical protein